MTSATTCFPGRGAGKPSYVNFATAPKNPGFDAGAPHSWRSVFRDWAGNGGQSSEWLLDKFWAVAFSHSCRVQQHFGCRRRYLRTSEGNARSSGFCVLDFERRE
jgi:hypothetical protein